MLGAELFYFKHANVEDKCWFAVCNFDLNNVVFFNFKLFTIRHEERIIKLFKNAENPASSKELVLDFWSTNFYFECSQK